MADFEGSSPSADSGASSDTSSAGADTSQDVGAASSQESADAGHAPGVGDDSTLAGQFPAPTEPGELPPSEFVFAGRKFPSQAKAEEWAKSQLGRVPDLQRKTAQYEQQLAQAQQQMEAMQQLLLRTSQQGGQGGPPQTPGAPAKPKSFAESLATGGENSPLAFIASLAEEKGIAHALYAFAEQQEQFLNERISEAVEQNVQPIQRREQFTQALNSVVGAARHLASTYPELDESNTSPEAQQAQQEILAIWKTLPPELQINDPARAWKLSVMEYREQHGTPIFATPPGTSGSPSARAALASEAGVAAETSSPLEGQTALRQRPGAQTAPLSAEDAFEQDILSADNSFVKSKDGKPLWRRVS
jgi:hypothetical protein